MAPPPLASPWTSSRHSRISARKRCASDHVRLAMEPIKTELVVVGAGPGGYAAAFYAADLGKKIILVERDQRLGGVCLNRGCIPSKALLHAAHTITAARESDHRGISFGEPTIDVTKLRAWKESILAKLAGGIS